MKSHCAFIYNIYKVGKIVKKNLLFTALVTLFGLGLTNSNISSPRADNDNFFVEKNNSVLMQSDNEVNDNSNENSIDNVVSSYLSFYISRVNYYGNSTLSLNLTASYVSGAIAELGSDPVFKFGDENNKLSLTFYFVNDSTYESLNESVTLQIQTKDLILGVVDENDESSGNYVRSIELCNISTVYDGFPNNALIDYVKINDIYTNVILDNGEYALENEVNMLNSYSAVYQEFEESPSQDVVSSLISVTATSESRSSLSVYYRLSIKLDTNNLAYYFDNPEKARFSVGYYGEDNFSEAQVEIIYGDETYFGKVQRQVGVGTTAVLYQNNSTLSTYADIQIPTYVDLDKASLKLTNIFFCDEVNNGEIYTDKPRFDNNYTVTITRSSYIEEFDISQFMDISASSISNFGGVRALKLKVEFNLVDGYKWLHDNGYLSMIFDYDNAISMVEKGNYFYRGYFSLSSFNESRLEGSYFEVTYDDGTTEFISNAASSQAIYDGVNYLTFFLYDAKNNIENVIIHEVSISLEIANKESESRISNSQKTFKFGSVATRVGDLIEKDEVVEPAVSYLSLNLDFIVILFTVIFSVVFVISAILIFILLKKKYKDDEYVKIKPKPYIKTSIYACITLYTILADILFIVLRVLFYNNTPKVFNIMDPIIIVFSIIGFLMACYFIRRFYISFKDRLEKRRRERLNLNTLNDDSGVN